MPRYRHTQNGWPTLLALGAGLGLLGDRVRRHGLTARAALAAGALVGAGILTSRLTIEVTDDALRASFGPGWPKKEVPLDEIESATPVHNPWWYGWGIRLTPSGPLWNVAGLDAVELRLRNGKRFRLGTDEPAALAGAIEAARLVPSAVSRSSAPGGGSG
jgi:hypothetical protein